MTSESLMKKQICKICKIPYKDLIKQNYDKEYVRQKMNSIPYWKENRIRIINPNSFRGVGDIARIQMTHKFDIWFLDFIQMLEFSSKEVSSASEFNIQVGQNMRNLLSLTLASNSIGIIISQIKKGVEYRKPMKPTISDIEWSGLIKQLSTYIYFSYYPGKYYGFDKIPQDYHFLLGEKTRFAESFIFPLKVIPETETYLELNNIEERQQRLLLLKKFLDSK